MLRICFLALCVSFMCGLEGKYFGLGSVSFLFCCVGTDFFFFFFFFWGAWKIEKKKIQEKGGLVSGAGAGAGLALMLMGRGREVEMKGE